MKESIFGAPKVASDFQRKYPLHEVVKNACEWLLKLLHHMIVVTIIFYAGIKAQSKELIFLGLLGVCAVFLFCVATAISLFGPSVEKKGFVRILAGAVAGFAAIYAIYYYFIPGMSALLEAGVSH